MATAEVASTFSLTLTVNEQEARALVSLLRCVGGSPTASRRGHTKDVYEAVMAATGWDYHSVPEADDLRGALIFEDHA